MKVWVTKYALTKDIQEYADAELDGGMIVLWRGISSTVFHGEGREWHRSLDAAKTRAEAMRVDKIASLQEQLKRLENLSF